MILNVALTILALLAAAAPAWSPTVQEALAESSAPSSSVVSAPAGGGPTDRTTTSTTSPSDVPSTPSPAGADSEFLRLTDSARARAGLRPLSWSDELAAYAHVHLARLMDTSRLWHSPEAQLLAIEGDWWVVGENLGVGVSVTAIQRALEESPTHLENITLSEFDSFGSASEVGSDGRLWTVHIYGAS